MSGPQDWLDGLKALAEAPDRDQERTVRLARLDPAYNPYAGSSRVTFDGESTLTAKAYPVLARLAQAGERVVMLRAGSSYVAVAALDDTAAVGSAVQRSQTRPLTTFNSDTLPSGVYDAQPGLAGAPDAGSWWLVHVLRHRNPTNNFTVQVAYRMTDAPALDVFVRRHAGGLDGATATTWTPWQNTGGDDAWRTVLGTVGFTSVFGQYDPASSSALGGPWTVRYRKRSGVVYVQGLARRVDGSNTAGGTVFQLPAGYTPGPIGVSMYLNTASAGAVRIDVQADGQFQVAELRPSAIVTDWFSVQASFPAG